MPSPLYLPVTFLMAVAIGLGLWTWRLHRQFHLASPIAGTQLASPGSAAGSLPSPGLASGEGDPQPAAPVEGGGTEPTQATASENGPSSNPAPPFPDPNEEFKILSRGVEQARAQHILGATTRRCRGWAQVPFLLQEEMEKPHVWLYICIQRWETRYEDGTRRPCTEPLWRILQHWGEGPIKDAYANSLLRDLVKEGWVKLLHVPVPGKKRPIRAFLTLIERHVDDTRQRDFGDLYPGFVPPPADLEAEPDATEAQVPPDPAPVSRSRRSAASKSRSSGSRMQIPDLVSPPHPPFFSENKGEENGPDPATVAGTPAGGAGVAGGVTEPLTTKEATEEGGPGALPDACNCPTDSDCQLLGLKISRWMFREFAHATLREGVQTVIASYGDASRPRSFTATLRRCIEDAQAGIPWKVKLKAAPVPRPVVEPPPEPAAAEPPPPVPSPEAATLWSTVRLALDGQLSAQNHALWIRPVVCYSVSESHVCLWAPNRFIADWVTQHYAPAIAEEVKRLLGERQIQVDCPERKTDAA